MHFHPAFALLVIPALLVSGLLYLPYINYEMNNSGIWFCSIKGRKLSLAAVLIGAVATIAAVLLDEYVIRGMQTGPANLLSNGLLPFIVSVIVAGGFYWLLKKRFGATNNEAVQALFTLLITAFIVLTIIGVWFRGTGMQLMWTG